jgi:hypothetical protein
VSRPRRTLATLALAALALQAALPARGEDLPPASLVVNASTKPWKVVLEKRADKDSLEVGSIRFYDRADDKKVAKELQKGDDAFTLEPGGRYMVRYMDAEKTLLTQASRRIHRVTFYLVDSTGSRVQLISERTAAPLSTVFVKAIVPSHLRAKAQELLHPNEYEPGNLTISADAVPMRMNF